MKKRIIAIVLCLVMVFTSVPIAFAATKDEGLVIDKTAVFDNATGEGRITLSSYLKGEVKSTPTDVVLVIDHSGSMWTAVEPVTGELKLDDLDTTKGKRVGYYVAFKKVKDATNNGEPVNRAYRVKYENGQWISDGGFVADTYDENGKFLGYINSVAGNVAKVVFNESNANEYIFAVSISGSLYDSLNAFMDEMQNAVDCRVAITTFAGKVYGETKNEIWKKNGGAISLVENVDYKGSGIFVNGTLTWDEPNSATLDKSVYEDAFENPTTKEGQEILYNSIESISTNYGNTPTALGLLYARRLFIQGGRDDAQRIAIVFTDGIPSPEYLGTRGAESCSHDDKDSEAAAACKYCAEVKTINKKGAEGTATRSTYVDQANKLKTSQKATVYSIGPKAGEAGTDVLNNIASSADKYYNASSNELSKVFEDIAGVIVQSSQQLNSNTQLVDTPSASFTLPKQLKEELEGKTEAEKNVILKKYVKVYTAEYDGVDAEGNDKFKAKVAFNDAKVELVGEDTIKVSNFAYDKNAVFMAGDNPNGKKLIVEIPFVAKDDFLGGDNVTTNDEESGVYNNNVLIDTFPVPDVDVNVKKVKSAVLARDIYLSQQAPLPEIINIGKYVVNGETYQVDGINNAYVDVKYIIEDVTNGGTLEYTIPVGTHYDGMTDLHWKSNGIETTHPVLKKDTTYKVTCSVTSVNKPSNETEEDVSTEVKVFKPEITFNDSLIYLGQTADYANNGGTSIVWKHGDTVAPESMGTAPTLEYKYSPVAGAFEKDTAVQVTKVTAKKANKGGEMKQNIPADCNITSHVTFYRDACTCDTPSCDNKTKTLVTDNKNFVVHVNSFSLVITKDGADMTKDPQQTFLFNVVGPNNLNLDVAVVGNGSKTIKNLPVGQYTVTEVKDWSWRYAPGSDSVTVKTADVMGNDKNEVMNVEFKNSRLKEFWLDGNAYIRNLFNQVTTRS